MQKQYKRSEVVKCPNCSEMVDIKNALQAEREKVLEECIKLSDTIESQYQTEFNEWRAFKGFRNTLRDELKK